MLGLQQYLAITLPQPTNEIFLIKESRTERRKLFPSQLQTEGKFKTLKSSNLTDKDLNTILANSVEWIHPTAISGEQRTIVPYFPEDKH